MSDVTALVLSVGEDYTARAIASVQRQTLPVAETITVQDISPFHRAFDSGVARVRTEFFIQVDADMILDETCTEDLRSCMADRVGMVVGHLRDPLLGRIQGIKLHSTLCCNQVRLRNTTSLEADFIEDMRQQSWTILYALKTGKGPSADWHAFGDHCPDYTPSYTFEKYVREGAKARYRKAGGGLRSVFQQLHASNHSAALIAVIAAAHGIFIKTGRDIHVPGAYSEEFARLESFFSALVTTRKISADSSPHGRESLGQGFRRIYDLIRQRFVAVQRSRFSSQFKRAYALGIRFRRQQAPSAFMTTMRPLQQANDLASWVALVGLCQGLFVDEYREAETEDAFLMLTDLLPR